MNLPRPETPDRAARLQPQDFFGKPAYLTVSGQLEAEIFALAFANVYTFGPTFRAENSNTPRHLAEFWMIEPEMAFCDLQGDMELAEEFLKSVLAQVMDRCAPDLEFFNKRIENTLLADAGTRGEQRLRAPYLHRGGADPGEARPRARRGSSRSHWGTDLQSEHERSPDRRSISKPVIVTDYPKEIKAFYMRLNDDGKTVRGDGCAGAAHRRDHRRQPARGAPTTCCSGAWRARAEGRGLRLVSRPAAVRFSAPHAGFGLGFERMMMYLTGMKNIRDVIPCPRTPGSAAF